LGLLTVLMLTGASVHPYYLAVTDLKLDERTNRIGGSLKIFVNDLEDAISRVSHKKVDLIRPRDSALVISRLSEYLKTRFVISANGVPYPVKVLGFEREEDIIWIYVEGEPVRDVRTVGIRNTLLYDFLPTQIHILNLSYRDKKWAYKLVCPEKEHSFQVAI
jgi:hypothetical protein